VNRLLKPIVPLFKKKAKKKVATPIAPVMPQKGMGDTLKAMMMSKQMPAKAIPKKTMPKMPIKGGKKPY